MVYGALTLNPLPWSRYGVDPFIAALIRTQVLTANSWVNESLGRIL
jgi:hypothetical protein